MKGPIQGHKHLLKYKPKGKLLKKLQKGNYSRNFKREITQETS
jgi:hypothetical protein